MTALAVAEGLVSWAVICVAAEAAVVVTMNVTVCATAWPSTLTVRVWATPIE